MSVSIIIVVIGELSWLLNEIAAKGQELLISHSKANSYILGPAASLSLLRLTTTQSHPTVFTLYIKCVFSFFMFNA